MKIFKHQHLIKSDWIKNKTNLGVLAKVIRIHIRRTGRDPKKLAVEYYTARAPFYNSKGEPPNHGGCRQGRIRYYTTPRGCSDAIEKYGFKINCTVLGDLLDQTGEFTKR
jgi:hypothetical protein